MDKLLFIKLNPKSKLSLFLNKIKTSTVLRADFKARRLYEANVSRKEKNIKCVFSSVCILIYCKLHRI